ncbi:MAG: VOC family protein [Pseudomonadota bacterium]
MGHHPPAGRRPPRHHHSPCPAPPTSIRPAASAIRPAAASRLLATPSPRDGSAASLLATDDVDRDHAAFTAAGVTWVRPPADQPYGRVAVFAGLYGNPWDMIAFAPGHPAAGGSPRSG